MGQNWISLYKSKERKCRKKEGIRKRKLKTSETKNLLFVIVKEKLRERKERKRGKLVKNQ